MPTILSIETSTKACSVALIRDNQILTSEELHIEHAHSEKLTILIGGCVANAGVTLDEMDAFAVAKGPGSYTGLRIGVATAKGLCYALDKPLIAINTLEAMAYDLSGIYSEDYWLCPMLDARRMEVYCALYDHRLRLIMPTTAIVVDAQSFQTQLTQKPILFFGNGAAKCRDALGGMPNARFADKVINPSAKAIALLAEEAYRRDLFENPADFEPFYLKEFVSNAHS
ncbi:MAG: tRNA (adenosine(37)-N6)-threonylcarbamoyltransferase complex dimerization subunit type 1 TsaB [Ferruginibacter sp.]|nr:tRNA (adenosine(37)-N6)-threonylcarbamoyltransferase complex dimerization subunit type 1 TsaB [Cytophagales bacterium]